MINDKQRPLTGKQVAFIEHYCGDCNYNASKAGRMAGYSLQTAEVIGRENLLKPAIKAAINEKMAELAKNIDVTVEFILSKLLTGLALAEKKQDLVALARFSELLGKHKAMFTDVIDDKSGQQRELDENQKAEAGRIANIRLDDIIEKAG